MIDVWKTTFAAYNRPSGTTKTLFTYHNPTVSNNKKITKANSECMIKAIIYKIGKQQGFTIQHRKFGIPFECTVSKNSKER